MVRPSHPVWSHFFCLYKHEETEDGPNRMKNGSHKAAWCIGCLNKVLSPQQDDDEDDIDETLLGKETASRLAYREALPFVEDLRGVPGDLIKHLLECKNVSKKVKNGWTVPSRDVNGEIQNHRPVQTTLKLVKGPHFTDGQKDEFKRDFLRLVVGCNIAFHKADHPSMEDFCSKWIGLKPPHRTTLSRRLLDDEKEAIHTKNMSLLAIQKGGTLICDGWNNSKREHLVSFMLLTRQHAIPLRHFDNSTVSRDGELAYKQVLEVVQWLKEQKIDVYGVCTDDGPDQVRDFIICESATTKTSAPVFKNSSI